MTPERWAEVERLYRAALTRDGGERDAFLREMCADDVALRREVELLLAQQASVDGFLGKAALAVAAPLVSQPAGTMLIGRQIGVYRLEALLGAGGMGEVYRARDTKLRRDVAIKILPRVFTSDPERLARFEREARMLAALNHPHIGAIYGVEEAEGLRALVLELVEGETLAARLHRGSMPVAEAITIARQLTDALDAAHEKGMVHRDLKPANIKITPAGTVKVLDFGLAKAADGAANLDLTQSPTISAISTRAGVILGTPAYMSPEQARGLAVDKRSDIWALGVLLYEMVSGAKPFSASTIPALFTSIMCDVPAPLSKAVPVELKTLIERCLNKEPERRYQHAREVRDALEQVQAGTGIGGPRPAERRRLMPWIVAATVGLVIAAVASGLLFTRIRLDAARKQIADARQMAEQGKPNEAFRLVRRLEPLLAGEPELARFWQDFTGWQANYQTTPPGATVFIKDYLDLTDQWERIGESPIEGFRASTVALRARFVRAGYETLEAAIVGPRISLRLPALGTAPQGMVYVPGGGVRFSTQRVGPFWIDRLEVTNEQYKRFLDAGGYRDVKYWTQPFRKRGRPLTFEQAMQDFQDATGRPGPATWELGAYPEGGANLPVSGVSWYEAAAYAAYAGKELPTVYHWYAANGEGSSEEFQLSNFTARAPWAVGTGKGPGRYGAYDMPGNVREWCWTAVGDNRSLVGGAYNDPSYVFLRADLAVDPFDRSDANGFRTVKYIEPVASDVLAAVASLGRDFKAERPVDDATYQTFLRMYAYDRTDLRPQIESGQDAPYGRVEKVTVDAAYSNERITAYLLLPNNADPPFQTVVYFPTAIPFFTQSSQQLELNYINFFVRSGRAVLFPVYKGTYERIDARLPFGAPPSVASRDLQIQVAKDLRRSVDYLETRADIDHDRLAFEGVSEGAIRGPVMTAIEERFKASILVGGGLFTGPAQLPEVDPLNFAPHVRVPTLMINGRDDVLFPVESSQNPLFQYLGVPAADKRHVLLDGSHNPLRLQEIIREALAWLDKYLGPVPLR